MNIALALGLSFLSGYLVVSAAWSREKANKSEPWMKLFISAGFGIGIFSIAFFVERWLGIVHILATDLCLIALLLAVYLVARARHKSGNLTTSRFADVKLSNWLHRLLMASLAISILAALYATVLRALAHPHGDGWDAFAIWNLHARFFFLGGSHWRDCFSTLIPWSHPDYPPLVPAAIAHVWSYIGHDDPIVPAIISFVFTFATLGLLVSSLAALRGITSAALAGIALASTPFFIEQGAAQYADIALSFFFLAAIALLHLYRQRSAQIPDGRQTGLFVLAGAAVGFAAWTKNEGLLFLFAFLIPQIAFFACRRRQPSTELRLNSVRDLVMLLLTIAPFLLLIAWFKHFIAPAGDLLSSSGTMIPKILTLGRYRAILEWYAKEFFRFGGWVVPTTVLFVALTFLRTSSGIRRQDAAFRSSVLTLALTLCGYFAVYVITPNDLYWHLRFSLNRLFLQLWPSTVFLFFLFVGRQTSSQSQTEPNSSQNRANC
ncbi:MAG TPA: glycosyltransferase family 39 protein [Candidatus Sulfotelmatobacter sp.]|nr:glycosyltransferase family 39 protein [Candidatus Sulfotelmatobacter sp.]